jgi:hypothetical protein
MKQAEKVDKIYYALYGVNGDEGMLARGQKRDAKIDALFKKWDDFAANRAATCPINNKEIADKVAVRLKITNAIRYVISLAGWATLITKLMGLW